MQPYVEAATPIGRARRASAPELRAGLRGPMLEHYANESIVEIEDLSDFVADQRQHVQAGRYERLLTPREEVLAIDHPELAARVGIAL